MKPKVDDFLTRPQAQELLGLGCVLRVGMAEIHLMEKLAGPNLENIYHTHFPAFDGQEWEVTLKKKTT